METEAIKLNKYNSVGFWRVLFTFAIAIFHFGNSYPGFSTAYHTKNGWSIGVEFFFIVSGFLLAHKCRTSNLSAFEYLKSRFQRLFPEYFFMILYLIPFWCITTQKGIKDTILFIFGILDDVTFLYATGISYTKINVAVWYLSSLIICGHIIYYMYKKWHETFVTLIAPASIIYIYTFLSRTYKKISGTIAVTPLYITQALLRGFAGITIGVLSYELYLRWRNIRLTKVGKTCASFIEVLGYISVFLLSSYLGKTRYDFLFVLLLFICVTLSFSRTDRNFIYHNPVIAYLNKISYSIYLNHIIVRDLFVLHFGTKTYHSYYLGIYLLIVLLWSTLAHFIVNQCVQFFHVHSRKISGVFLEQEK